MDWREAPCGLALFSETHLIFHIDPDDSTKKLIETGIEHSPYHTSAMSPITFVKPASASRPEL